MGQFLCYCFEYTEADIIQDIKKNKGKSSILQRIKAAKSRGTCQCDIKHPEKK